MIAPAARAAGKRLQIGFCEIMPERLALERDLRARTLQKLCQMRRACRWHDGVMLSGTDENGCAGEVRHVVRDQGHHRSQQNRAGEHVRMQERQSGRDVGAVGEATATTRAGSK